MEILRFLKTFRKHGHGAWALHWTCAVLLMLASPSLLRAQNTGSVAGTVADSQGKIIIGAKVELTLPAQGRQFHTVTNSRGEYSFREVAVGSYNLRISSAGFEDYVVKTIQVDAEQSVRLDTTLEIGAADAQVTVEASGTTIDTRSATMGTMIDNKLVENLPIDGNNVVSLAALLPGVTNVNAPTTFTSDTGGPTYNVSGARSNQNLFLFDGMMWNNLFYNTGMNFPPPYALQETSVLLNNYKAQYGRNAGSIMNVLSRSGTNSFHGTAWEYIQNKALNATDYISKQNPKLVSNQFGGTLGGPIRRDKAFFFLSYQDLRQVAQVTAQDLVPDLAERGLSALGVGRPCTSSQFAGHNCATFVEDYPGATGSAAIANASLKNPMYSSSTAPIAISQLNSAWVQAGNTGTSPCVTLLKSLASPYNKYLPNAEVPDVCFNPVAMNFYNKYSPLPNLTISGNSLYAVTSANEPRNDQEGMIRVDFKVRNHMFDAHFYMTNVNDMTANGVSNGAGIAGYEKDMNTGGITFGSIGDTAVISSNLVNVARAGYKRYVYKINPTDHTTLQDLGANFSEPATVPALPEIELNGDYTVGGSSSVYSNTVNEDIEVNDNLSWSHGRHNYQFGFQYLHLQYLHVYDFEPSLDFEGKNTGDTGGDFLMGMLYQLNVGNSVNLGAIQNAVYFYGQDDWRITSRLTLNYGLRYELAFPWYSPDKEALTFVPGYQSKVFPGAPPNMAFEGDPGIPNSIAPKKFNHVAPRVGMVFDLHGNGNTLLLGGFGLFYDSVNASVVGVGEPYHYSAEYASPMGGLSQPLLGENAVPDNYHRGQTPQFVGPFAVNYADPKLSTPYVETLNAGIRQRIRKSATVEVDGVMRLGRKQMMQLDQNPAIYDCSGAYYQVNPTVYCTGAAASSASYVQRVKYPGYNYGGSGAVDNATVGTSNYYGLQVIYQQHMSKSLNLIASYTLSRSLDLQSNGQTTSNQIPEPWNTSIQYGPSDFNAAQVLNIGGIWKIPQLHRGFRVLRIAANTWSIGGISNMRSGTPFNITMGGDSDYFDERPERPSLAAGMDPNIHGTRSRQAEIGEYFNTNSGNTNSAGTAVNCTTAVVTTGCVWERTLPGQFGNVSRNKLTGPGYNVQHLSLTRIFQLPRPGLTLQYRADAFNVLNTPNFSNPNASLGSAATDQGNFGKILSTVGTNGSVGTNGRRVQMSLILNY